MLALCDLKCTYAFVFFIVCVLLVVYSLDKQLFRLNFSIIRFCNVPYFGLLFSEKLIKTFNYKNLASDAPNIVSKEIKYELDKFIDPNINKFLNSINQTNISLKLKSFEN